MTYLDIALWVSAIVLWIFVVWKIVSGVIEWFEKVETMKTQVERLLKQQDLNMDNFDSQSERMDRMQNYFDDCIERLEKKKR